MLVVDCRQTRAFAVNNLIIVCINQAGPGILRNMAEAFQTVLSDFQRCLFGINQCEPAVCGFGNFPYAVAARQVLSADNRTPFNSDVRVSGNDPRASSSYPSFSGKFPDASSTQLRAKDRSVTNLQFCCCSPEILWQRISTRHLGLPCCLEPKSVLGRLSAYGMQIVPHLAEGVAGQVEA